MRTIFTVVATASAMMLSAQEPAKENNVDRSALDQHGPNKSRTGRFQLDMGMGLNAAQRSSALVKCNWYSAFGNQIPTHPPEEFVWPTFFVEAEYRITGKLSLGAHYDHWQDEQWVKDGLEAYGSFWNSVNTYMASARWTWSSNGSRPEFYSGVMAGAAFRHFASRLGADGHSEALPHGDSTLPAYQVTVIGMRTGGRVGFLMEVGYGYKGMISTGLSYRF